METEEEERISRSRATKQFSKVEDNICFRASLNDMRSAGMYTDVCLSCGNSRLPAHKVVLAAKSKYFRELFGTDDMNPAEVIVLQGIEPRIMEALLDYMYKGEIDLKVFPHDKLLVLVAAGLKLKIRGYRTYVINRMLETLTTVTFRPALEVAELVASKDMQSKVMAYIAGSLDSLWVSNDLLSLPIEKISNVFATAVHNNVNQDLVLRSVLAWVKHDRERREVYLPTLVLMVKLHDITATFARCLIEDDPLVRDHPELHSRMQQQRSKMDEEQDKDEGLSDEILCSSRGNHHKHKHSYEKTVSDTPVIPMNDSSVSSSSSYSFRDEVNKPVPPLIVTVGRNEFEQLSVMYYSIKADTWSDGELLQLPFIPNQGILYVDNCVYVVGGEDSSQPNNKMVACHMRDLKEHKTQRLPDLRVGRSNPLLFMAGGALYVAAGTGRYGPSGLSHVERLDNDESPAWKNSTAMREKRDGKASVCCFGGKVYVAGGGSQRVEYFSPANKAWHDLAPLPEDLREVKCFLAAAGDLLWLFRDFKPNKVFWLDEAKSAWKCQLTKGVSPETVTSIHGWMTKVFATDKNNAMNVYDTMTSTWYYVNKVPRCMAEVQVIRVEEEGEGSQAVR